MKTSLATQSPASQLNQSIMTPIGKRWLNWVGLFCATSSMNMAACSPNENKCSPTLHCGACDHAIRIDFINEATGALIGRNGESMAGMKLVGADGFCSSLESCYVYAKDHSPETVYTFDVVYRDEVLASYSLTSEVDPEPARCCRCGYNMRIVELTLDWEAFSGQSTPPQSGGGFPH